MSRLRYDRLDLISVAFGGVLGASLRWLITRANAPTTTGGWFAYAPNTSVTVGTNAFGAEPVRSAETIATSAGIPIDTLVVNLLGCVILGALTVRLVRSSVPPRRALIGAATGFCGSLTTFSTFAVELAILLRGKPVLPPEFDGLNVASNANVSAANVSAANVSAANVSTALVYVTLSLAGGALAFWLGRRLAQRIVTSPGDVTIDGAA